MSDTPSSTTPPPSGAAPLPRPAFPVVRLLYSFGYGLIAWFVLHVIFVLAALQFVMIAINGRVHDEIKSFCSALLQYEWELLAFIAFVCDEQPFPVGPFPKHA
ncbi:MAG TPA: DUF4389 domain-containing protein [Rhizomicrobium sp.]|nr:DUF4389 domain-containing protein [Rhizomicrobium sp.]